MAGYECRGWLPVNKLGGAMTRHPAHLTEEQVAQRVRQQVEASLDPGGPITTGTPGLRWSPAPAHGGALRSVSFQLPCEEDVLPSAFEDKPLCVPQQLAELLQLSVEEVCADFDAMLRHDWRRLGISAEEVREFCVWRNAPMRVLSSQGDLVDSYDPALKERRTVCFLAFDGHCYMYRAVKRVLERQATRVARRGRPCRPSRRRGRAAGAVLVRGPAGGAAAAVRGAQPGVPGPAPGRLGARDFLEAAEGEAGSARRGGEAEDPGRAGRQVRAVRLRADGHLRAGPRGAGEAGLCGQRADFAGAVRRLPQREDAEGERAAHEFGEPGVMEYVRSPKLPPLVFEAQACAKDALYVGVDVVRCRRNGLANAPFPLPILCPADGVEPVDGVLPDLGFVEGCCDARQSCLNLLPYVGPGWYPKVSLAAMLGLGVGTTSCWASPRGATWTRRRCGARWSAWTPRGPRARSTWPSSA